MPDGNPLKRVLTALSYRIGATAAAGLLAIPIEPIPGLDVLYDIGIPVALIIYWVSFFKNAADPSLRQAQQPRVRSLCTGLVGWGGRDRTSDWRNQNQMIA